MIETVRLVLRPFTADDAQDFARMFADQGARKYTRYADDNSPAAIQQEFEQHFLQNPDTAFAITLKATQEMIGFFEFHDGGVMTYLLMPEYWRHGYMPEAGRAMVDYAFTQLDYQQIQGDYASVNGASGRVLAKMGLIDQGAQHEFTLDDGTRITVMSYKLTRAEWLARQK
ncbi:GNAT family N-acetyltransferase [Lacticaseibacillus zhaodongensis]|uniref:GNAT family N-acetyltransferase n=1 Tax=Lacticaseibacillus zhaodongensis TaxID=2668065 RepID=UPI0012D3596B|nr:GNAT family N-acetyltransferase [Lacticaseibacillus zhaodongensis]